MCFYNSYSKRALDLAKRYSRKTDLIEIVQEILDEQYKITAFTNPDCPVITRSPDVQLAQWGLVPGWVQSGEDASKIRKMNLIARSETAFNLPSFRRAIQSRRCLIPSTGYFEFQHIGKNVIPHYIFLRDEPIFSFGGIVEFWQNPSTGETIQTFAVLTTAANSLCTAIHNGGKNPGRMPVIIRRENEERWLDNALKVDEIKPFFEPLEAGRMNAWPVAGDFMKRNPKDSSLIEPAA
jgi:putative SOS response-associated peptidase YedK